MTLSLEASRVMVDGGPSMPPRLGDAPEQFGERVAYVAGQIADAAVRQPGALPVVASIVHCYSDCNPPQDGGSLDEFAGRLYGEIYGQLHRQARQPPVAVRLEGYGRDQVIKVVPA